MHDTSNRITALLDPQPLDASMPGCLDASPPPLDALMPQCLEALLLDYIDTDLPTEGIAARHNLTLFQLLDIVNSPAFLARLEQLEAAAARRTKAIARACMPEAAFVLRSITNRFLVSDEHHEPARKAVNQLSRLAAEAAGTPSPRDGSDPPPSPAPPRGRAGERATPPSSPPPPRPRTSRPNPNGCHGLSVRQRRTSEGHPNGASGSHALSEPSNGAAHHAPHTPHSTPPHPTPPSPSHDPTRRYRVRPPP